MGINQNRSPHWTVHWYNETHLVGGHVGAPPISVVVYFASYNTCYLLSLLPVPVHACAASLLLPSVRPSNQSDDEDSIIPEDVDDRCESDISGQWCHLLCPKNVQSSPWFPTWTGKMGKHFQSGKSQGTSNRLEKSGKFIQNTGKEGIIASFFFLNFLIKIYSVKWIFVFAKFIK